VTGVLLRGSAIPGARTAFQARLTRNYLPGEIEEHQISWRRRGFAAITRQAPVVDGSVFWRRAGIPHSGPSRSELGVREIGRAGATFDWYSGKRSRHSRMGILVAFEGLTSRGVGKVALRVELIGLTARVRAST